MLRFSSRSLVSLLCLSAALGHVKNVARDSASHLVPLREDGGTTSAAHTAEHVDTASMLGNIEQPHSFLHRQASVSHRGITKSLKGQCVYMLAAVVFLCCCGGLVTGALGKERGSQVNMFISMFCFCYLIFSGIYSAYWNGDNVGIYCKIMCWWAILQMTCACCFCCVLCLAVGSAVVIKNEMIKKMREDYENKLKDISGPRKDYYESELFKEKCDGLFEKADVDRTGSLDMNELRDILEHITSDPRAAECAPLLLMAFDEHGSSKVEKDEFVEMMKYVSVSTLQPGKFTVEQAFEVLLLPETATKRQVNESYRNLALKYHPDKRCTEVANKDMGEINDAKAMVEEHLKKQAAPDSNPAA